MQQNSLENRERYYIEREEDCSQKFVLHVHRISDYEERSGVYTRFVLFFLIGAEDLLADAQIFLPDNVGRFKDQTRNNRGHRGTAKLDPPGFLGSDDFSMHSLPFHRLSCLPSNYFPLRASGADSCALSTVTPREKRVEHERETSPYRSLPVVKCMASLFVDERRVSRKL